MLLLIHKLIHEVRLALAVRAALATPMAKLHCGMYAAHHTRD